MRDEELVKDPVCGMVKPKNQFGYSTVYNGKIYYFCSEMDKEMFEKYPDRWISPPSRKASARQGGEGK